MKIIKRSGQETSFDEEKIVNAVKKANKEVNEVSRISDEQIRTLAHGVAEECLRRRRKRAFCVSAYTDGKYPPLR